MKRHLLKYFLLVLALFASIGVLWADCYMEVNVDSIAQVEISDSFSCDNTSDSPTPQIEEVSNNRKQCAEVKAEAGIWKLLLPAIIIILFVIIYGIAKIWNSEEYRKLFSTKKYKRLCAKIISNAVSRDGLSIIGAISILLLLITILTFGNLLYMRWMDPSTYQEFNLSRLGVLGDFAGGIIGTLIAFVVAIYAIRTYRLERQYQKEGSVLAMLSTMLDLHRKNVEDIHIIKTGTRSNLIKGREAFEQMYNELKEIFEYVIEAIQTEVESDRQKYSEWVDENKQIKLAHILSYGYFFYSVDTYMIPKEDDDVNLYQLCEKAAASVSQQYRHLHRHVVLGHYYRHLYNMVNYIDKNEFSQQYQKKEQYVKLIRSQLSDYEQILLYYDTLSLLGKDWNEPIGEKEIPKMNLICKYRIIKNCPNYMYYFGLKPADVYANEKATWDKKKEYFLETDSKWQQEALKKMLS